MKFKYIIILLVCASIQISSQAQEKEEIVQTLNTNIEDFWNEPDADFIVKSYPTNWKDATGVVIASKSILRFDKKTKNKLFSSAEKIVIYEQTRLKIALNDKDAINDYSEVYFRFRNKKDGFKAKIIKPDGKEETLDLSAAITVENESEVNQRFLGFWDRSNSKANGYFKLAVPNLQEGDILEYAYEHFNELPITGENYYEFEPVYYLCNRYYPVLIQKIEIQTDNKSYVNAKSINGAPEFKEITGNDFNTFKWEDKNRDAVKDTRWVNEYLTMPMVKFQIVYSKNNDNGLAFISNKGELKKSILAEELANKVAQDV